MKKRIQHGKEEVNLSFCEDDMLVHIEKSKEAKRKLLKLINEFSKVAGYKIITEKSASFPYTVSDRSEGETQETIPFTIASNRRK